MPRLIQNDPAPSVWSSVGCCCMSIHLTYMWACPLMPWQNVRELQEVLAYGLSFFSDGMSLLLELPPFSASHRFTTKQMAVIWEVLRWAHFIALLMHSHKQAPPLLSFAISSFSLVLSPFLSSCLPSSTDQSQSLTSPCHSLGIFSCFCLCAKQMCPPHTLVTNSLSLESNPGTFKTPTLSSPPLCLIMHIILSSLLNCTKWQLLALNPVLEYAPGRQLGKERGWVCYLESMTDLWFTIIVIICMFVNKTAINQYLHLHHPSFFKHRLHLSLLKI